MNAPSDGYGDRPDRNRGDASLSGGHGAGRQGQSGSQGYGDTRNQVLQAINIVDLIGRTVGLKRAGKNYIGLCPFHQEKSPSFNVDPVKQYFHCFGCKKSGTAIDFVIERDRVDFKQALRTLADEAGIEIKSFGGSKERSGERQALLDAHSAAGVFFEKLLSDPVAGKPARDYLAQRGFNEEAIKRFHVGLAPDGWDGLLKSPLMRKFPPPLLALGGLVKAREGGNGFYDTFRNRLMFPIRDENGRVIGFGGRVMPGSPEAAKYLNSPETPLFSKSRCVFGLDLARQKIVETQTAAIVEGYTDVVMSHQYGATNVVSPLGTALTEQHVKVLMRFANKIVLLFDADAAGDRAVDRAVELFLTQPIEIAIASIPDGLDPDEFLLKHGLDAFNELLAGAADALSYKWKQLVRRFVENARDLTGQQKAVEDYLKLVADARAAGPVDPLRWGQALTRVSRLTEIPVEELNRRFKLPKSARSQKLGSGQTVAGARDRGNGYGAGGKVDAGGRPARGVGPVYNGRASGGPANGRRSADGDASHGAGEVEGGGYFGNGTVDAEVDATVDAGYAAQVGDGNEPTLDHPDDDSTAIDYLPRDLTGRDRAENIILGVLLAEPHRWSAVQMHVGPDDFTHPTRRAIAEKYWDHQRNEGEPVFNEFLSQLEGPGQRELAARLLAESESVGNAGGGPALVGGSAMSAVGVDERTADRMVDAAARNAVVAAAELRDGFLNGAIDHLKQDRRRQEERKLMARLRRSTGEEPLPPQDAVALLKALQEKARQPDLRRVGG